jgi:hypothetical protein
MALTAYWSSGYMLNIRTGISGFSIFNSDIKPPLPVVDPERFYRSGEK